LYNITINSGGGNPLALNASVKVESIISKDNFATPLVLAEIDLPFTIPADEAAALQYVIDNTTLAGDLCLLTATFPPSIPPVIVAEPYKINSRFTLANVLPTGTTITIKEMATLKLAVGHQLLLDHSGTQIYSCATPANFDANYGGEIENYEIIIINPANNPAPFSTTVLIESIISKDLFVNNTVIASSTEDLTIPTIVVTGFTANGTPMAGNLNDGYTLNLNCSDANTDFLLQFAAGTTSNAPLKNEYFGLYLNGLSGVAVADLEAYYNASGAPQVYIDYLINAANGDEPFALINGSSLKLVDAAKHFIAGGADVDMPFRVTIHLEPIQFLVLSKIRLWRIFCGLQTCCHRRQNRSLLTVTALQPKAQGCLGTWQLAIFWIWTAAMQMMIN
jgi:hypothetical protein